MRNQKDEAQKKLEDFADVFADILNVLLFDGKKIVDEDSLKKRATQIGLQS